MTRKDIVQQLIKMADRLDQAGLHDDAQDVDRVVKAIVQRSKDEKKGIVRVSIVDMMEICPICAHEMVDDGKTHWILNEGDL